MVRDSRSPDRSRRSEYRDRDSKPNSPPDNRNYSDSRRHSRHTEDRGGDAEYQSRRGDRGDRERDRDRDGGRYKERYSQPREREREREREPERLREMDRAAYQEMSRRRRSRSRDKQPASDRPRDGRNDERSRRSSQRSASPSRHRSQSVRSKSPEEEDKAKPNFNPSGLLAAATKTVAHADGTKTVLKYHEPPEARKPTVGWRLYVFKGKEQVDLLHIHRQSAYLVGRDRLVADIAIEHPSCSKQHAALQFRQIREKNEFGDTKTAIKPFIIDLESTNGTIVNEETIPAARYYELKLGDVIKFGESAREYVLLSEDAA